MQNFEARRKKPLLEDSHAITAFFASNSVAPAVATTMTVCGVHELLGVIKVFVYNTHFLLRVIVAVASLRLARAANYTFMMTRLKRVTIFC